MAVMTKPAGVQISRSPVGLALVLPIHLAYDRYRQDVFAKSIANEQQMTAQMNSMDWGPWGPGWWYQATFERRTRV